MVLSIHVRIELIAVGTGTSVLAIAIVPWYSSTMVLVHVYHGTRIVVEIRAADIAVELEPYHGGIP